MYIFVFSFSLQNFKKSTNITTHKKAELLIKLNKKFIKYTDTLINSFIKNKQKSKQHYIYGHHNII